MDEGELCDVESTSGRPRVKDEDVVLAAERVSAMLREELERNKELDQRLEESLIKQDSQQRAFESEIADLRHQLAVLSSEMSNVQSERDRLATQVADI